MPIHMMTLPYQPNDILDIFTPLADKPWSMLLHSGDNTYPEGRFDILVALPAITLISRNGVTEINSGAVRQFSTIDPFKLVQQQLVAIEMKSTIDDRSPFMGGALGLFSYDLVRYIEVLPTLAKQDLAMPDMAIGIYRWAIIADHIQHKVMLISHDDPTDILTRLATFVPLSSIPFRLLSSWQSNMSRTDYGTKFRQIQQHLLSGNCYQVCLSQRFSAPCIGNNWQAFRHLLTHNQVPFSAFIRLEQQTIISVSPERFLHVRNKKIQTQPIKGTLSRLPNADLDRLQIDKLALSTKDQAENLMIVDLLRNDIGRVAQPGSVQVPSLFAIKTFNLVHHMVSTITATLSEDRSLCDLLRACFPGGSITGAPKIRAMEIIEQLEPQRRSAWCGSIGYISCCGTMDTNIAIRTLIIDNGYIYCSVGGGIVSDSDEEEEYQETLIKAASILPILGQLHT